MTSLPKKAMSVLTKTGKFLPAIILLFFILAPLANAQSNSQGIAKIKDVFYQESPFDNGLVSTCWNSEYSKNTLLEMGIDRFSIHYKPINKLAATSNIASIAEKDPGAMAVSENISNIKGNASHSYCMAVTGLTPNTLYYFAIVAQQNAVPNHIEAYQNQFSLRTRGQSANSTENKCSNSVTDINGKYIVELVGLDGKRSADCRFSVWDVETLSGTSKLIAMDEYFLTFDSENYYGKVKVSTTSPSNYWAEFTIGKGTPQTTVAPNSCKSPLVEYQGQCVDPIPGCLNPPPNSIMCIDKIQNGVRKERFYFECINGSTKSGSTCIGGTPQTTVAPNSCKSPLVEYRGQCVDPIPGCKNPPANYIPSTCIDKIENGVYTERYNFQCLDGYTKSGKECVKAPTQSESCTNRVTKITGNYIIDLLGSDGQKSANCRFSEYTFDILSGTAKNIGMTEYSLTFDDTLNGKIRVNVAKPTKYQAEFTIGGSATTTSGIFDILNLNIYQAKPGFEGKKAEIVVSEKFMATLHPVEIPSDWGDTEWHLSGDTASFTCHKEYVANIANRAYGCQANKQGTMKIYATSGKLYSNTVVVTVAGNTKKGEFIPCVDPPANYTPSSCIDIYTGTEWNRNAQFSCLPGYERAGNRCVSTATSVPTTATSKLSIVGINAGKSDTNDNYYIGFEWNGIEGANYSLYYSVVDAETSMLRGKSPISSGEFPGSYSQLGPVEPGYKYLVTVEAYNPNTQQFLGRDTKFIYVERVGSYAQTQQPESYNVIIPPAGYEDEVRTAYNAYENPFEDTSTQSLIGIAAAELYNRAIIGGYRNPNENGKPIFDDSKPVNRAEAAKFLLLARGAITSSSTASNQFKDVMDGQWYTEYVVKAANLGIIDGYPDGTFRPSNNVQRDEFLKMLARTFDIAENLPYNYSDVPSDAWFAQYAGVAQAYSLFIDDNTALHPGNKMTRGEVAIAIYQYLKNR